MTIGRSRVIKYSFFGDEKIVGLSPIHRLLFIGLWCLADREGRLRDRPNQIRLNIFPGEDVDVNSGLEALQAAGLVIRYEAESERLLQIRNFQNHQTPHHKEAESILPPCLADGCGNVEPNTVQASATSNSGMYLVTRNSKHSNGGGGGETPESSFAGFWSVYPRRVGKGAAETAWKKAVRVTSAEAIIAGLERQLPNLVALAGKDGGRFVPHPATWLNQKRWEDDAQAIGGSGTSRVALDGTDWSKTPEGEW